MNKLYALFVCSFLSITCFSQTVVIDPATGGGFESGATFALNGWTVVNGPSNQWAVGTGSFIGTRGAYIGTPAVWVGANVPSVNHFYSNPITIPASATNVTLSFRIKQQVIDPGYDSIVVSTVTGPTLPAVGTHIGGAPYTRWYNNTGTLYFNYTPIVLNLSSLAGSTFRLVFTYVNDGSNPIGIPAIDSVSLNYCSLPAITGLYTVCEGGSTITLSDATTGGTWSSSLPGVASVSSTGDVTGNVAGITNIIYTVGACSISAPVTVNPLPAVYNVTGGGSICSSGPGADIALDWSDPWITYDLSDGTSTVSSLPGVGGILDFSTFTTAATYTVAATDMSTNCTSNMAGSAVITIASPVVPSVNIAPATLLTCAGNSVTLVATPVNGGTTPAYEWIVNGTSMGFGLNTYSYTPASGDVVSVILYPGNICTSPVTATDAYTVTVTPNVIPSITVSAFPGNPGCLGNPVTFTGVPVYGGSSPSYTWTKNGVNVATGPTFTYTPVNGDILFCTLLSDYTCLITNTAVSSNVTMSMTTGLPAPVVSVSAHPGANIFAGQSDTLKAVATGAGASTAVYAWYVNGIPVSGAVTNTFISNTLANMDIVTCKVSNSDACAHSTLSSVSISVSNLAVSEVNTGCSDVSIFPNPNKGIFTVKGTLGVITDQEISLEITNMLGQVVYKNKLLASNGKFDTQVSLTDVAAGIYLLNMHTENERKVVHFSIE